MIFSVNTHRLFLQKIKSTTITNTFQKILKESNRKPNKIWVDNGTEYYHTSMKLLLQDNNIEMYSTHNEKKNLFFLKDL